MDNPLIISAKWRGFRVIFAIALILLAYPGATPGSDSDPGVQVLYDDQCTPSCLKYIQERSGEGINGSNGLQLNADRWHSPVYTLYCGGGERQNFTPYDVIEFHFRSLEPDPGNPTFSLATWNQTSNVLSISDYIDEGLIDSTWRRVRIPLADLKTATWDLGNVEKLNWNKDSLNRSYLVDDIVLKSITPPVLTTTGENAPFPESNRVLRLTFSKRYDHKSVKTLSNYILSSDTDPSYECALNPLDAGIHYRVQGFTESKTPVIGYQVFLKLPAPMKNGHAYILSVQDITDPSGNLMEPATYSFTYDDTGLLNPNIKVNQVGYLPDAPKIGYVGGYLGDLGGGAWAVGENGAICSWDDQEGWIEVTSPVSSNLRAVAAIRENSVWAVGEGGTILQWNGLGWSPIESPTSEDLFGIAFGPTNIGWAVGAGGTTLRFVDGAWTRIDTPVKQTLKAVWAGPGDTAWRLVTAEPYSDGTVSNGSRTDNPQMGIFMPFTAPSGTGYGPVAPTARYCCINTVNGRCLKIHRAHARPSERLPPMKTAPCGSAGMTGSSGTNPDSAVRLLSRSRRGPRKASMGSAGKTGDSSGASARRAH